MTRQMEVCNEDLRRDCNLEGETVCREEYKTGEWDMSSKAGNWF